MGQQQLLLIVLGVIIVGIAIAVGISMFKSNAQSSNRDQVINDLNNLAAKGQQYFRKPKAMAGGGQSFKGFALAPVDTGNANGSYRVVNSDPGTTFQTTYTGDTTSCTLGPVCYILGTGNELGNDGTHPVQAVAIDSANAITVHVLN